MPLAIGRQAAKAENSFGWKPFKNKRTQKVQQTRQTQQRRVWPLLSPCDDIIPGRARDSSGALVFSLASIGAEQCQVIRQANAQSASVSWRTLHEGTATALANVCPLEQRPKDTREEEKKNMLTAASKPTGDWSRQSRKAVDNLWSGVVRIRKTNASAFEVRLFANKSSCFLSVLSHS